METFFTAVYVSIMRDSEQLSLFESGDNVGSSHSSTKERFVTAAYVSIMRDRRQLWSFESGNNVDSSDSSNKERFFTAAYVSIMRDSRQLWSFESGENVDEPGKRGQPSNQTGDCRAPVEHLFGRLEHGLGPKNVR